MNIKMWFKGISEVIRKLISNTDTTTTTNDKKWRLRLKFHHRSLEERNCVPNEVRKWKINARFVFLLLNATFIANDSAPFFNRLCFSFSILWQPNTQPTKYHYYPHHQQPYFLPECAIQQVSKNLELSSHGTSIDPMNFNFRSAMLSMFGLIIRNLCACVHRGKNRRFNDIWLITVSSSFALLTLGCLWTFWHFSFFFLYFLEKKKFSQFITWSFIN